MLRINHLVTVTFVAVLATAVVASAIFSDDVTMRRDDGPAPSPEQLLATCPGGSIHNADKCTFEPDGTTSKVYQWLVSNAGENCDPDAKTDLKITLKISQSSRDAYSDGVTVGTGIAEEGVGIKIENTAMYEKGVTVSHDELYTAQVEPHSSKALVAQTGYTRHNGRICVNYGNKVGGHYIWYVKASNDVPDRNDVVRTTIPLRCGQTPDSVIQEWNHDPAQRRLHY
ncbi:hypothetical protein BDZ90DRAFT_259719 [Jaminaea rosea]|uniref:Ig-like domain-containing protein n=1 Tax=Jaminaea rosea TaxID=1569628 RepID=A0A316URD5_9BASI|nr:hypothetical protein BDZ90DRAFT_259719 [Jaminaea rosea]PWN27880.1 hypothetical protein BDZ90DRAFT_259719 [Jaminaea rosea]